MTQTKKPNVILICSDHHRADVIGSYGHKICRTPNLDRLASQGTQFNRCYSQNPVCMPARASIVTGTNSRRHGVSRNGKSLDPNMPTVASLLKERGYRTASVGKNHLSQHNKGTPTAPYFGFDRLDSLEDNTIGPYLEWIQENFPKHENYVIGTLFNLPTDDKYWADKRDLRKEYLQMREKYVAPLEISKTCNWGFGHFSPLPEEAHKNTWITDHALDCVRKHNTDDPLLLWVGYVDPHNPFDPPKRFQDMYSPDDIPSPIFREGEEDLWPPHQRSLHEYFKVFTDKDWRTLRALFYGSVTFMDEQIGRLIDGIEQKLDMDNTIIVYLADHGDILGDHHICGKSAHHYDPCIHIPMICRWDGQWQAGAKVDEIIEQTDLLPSLLDAMGMQTDTVMDGKSFASALKTGEHDNPRGYSYSESFAGSPEDHTKPPVNWARTIRSDRWRATFYPEADHGELFDMQNDPEEVFNLWYDPEHKSVIEEHRKILCDRLIMMDFPIPTLEFSV